jgi:hypothetical protein
MSKERPILFSTPMVQAILEGRKTMTRRIVKPQPSLKMGVGKWIKNKNIQMIGDQSVVINYMEQNSPYGVPGDVLWVREKFAARDCDTAIHKVTIEYAASEGEKHYIFPKKSMKIIQKPLHAAAKYQPSIHMPKDACRIKLLIKSIRVERLQEITRKDAKAEGIERITIEGKGSGYKVYGDNSDITASEEFSFYTLWESINGLGSWEANPWVWVIEFEKL